MTRTVPKVLQSCDALVVGAGPAGLAAAIALAVTGCRAVSAGQRFNPNPAKPDTRTTALLTASVDFLKNLNVWHQCETHAAPLEKIRLIDDTGRLLRAPETIFTAHELGWDAFGYNIANSDLVSALLRTARDLPNLQILETHRASINHRDAGKAIIDTVEGDMFETRLIAAADGRNSACRTHAGIKTRGWSYPQTAIACNFDHDEHHQNTSNEFHRPAGPFTTVPLPGNCSSLVWVETPEETARLMELGDGEFVHEIERRLHGILGTVTHTGPRAAFPLSGLMPSCFARNRIALVGEAAHVIPPIGAQGLNLGFRDAATLAGLAGNALSHGRDPGGDDIMHAYNKARRSDIYSRALAVDIANRSLISNLLPLQALRSAGLHILGNIAPLRRFIMRQGVAPDMGLPELMQSQAGRAHARSEPEQPHTSIAG